MRLECSTPHQQRGCPCSTQGLHVVGSRLLFRAPLGVGRGPKPDHPLQLEVNIRGLEKDCWLTEVSCWIGYLTLAGGGDLGLKKGPGSERVSAARRRATSCDRGRCRSTHQKRMTEDTLASNSTNTRILHAPHDLFHYKTMSFLHTNHNF